MPTSIAESTTKTYAVTPSMEYVFSLAGTWDGITARLMWSNGVNDVDFPDGTFTDDGGIIFIAPTNTIKVVTGADSGDLGDLTLNIYETETTGGRQRIA